jgi:hypothetical protein
MFDISRLCNVQESVNFYSSSGGLILIVIFLISVVSYSGGPTA